ncbi:helix-turn-helix domain-containing protein [Pseudoflavonifractor phocaeensis]|uniref:helix-turn-helix domain-containing protein n=1 Tax=Pseudoflavonifractor phocaeensis TaxID=1870988 RepID=UPI00399C5F68
MQQNFNTYLNDCRVENAKKLLATSDMPAQEIGYLTGFCSVATFFRVFKKHTNMTPKQFRQSIDHKEEQP